MSDIKNEISGYANEIISDSRRSCIVGCHAKDILKSYLLHSLNPDDEVTRNMVMDIINDWKEARFGVKSSIKYKMGILSDV